MGAADVGKALIDRLVAGFWYVLHVVKEYRHQHFMYYDHLGLSSAVTLRSSPWALWLLAPWSGMLAPPCCES